MRLTTDDTTIQCEHACQCLLFSMRSVNLAFTVDDVAQLHPKPVGFARSGTERSRGHYVLGSRHRTFR